MAAENNGWTPRTNNLREAILARNVLRGFNMPEDHRDALDLAAQLEEQNAELVAALTTMLSAFGLETAMSVDASMARCAAKKQARAALAKAQS